MPYSRATTAPWEFEPPISITSPPAVKNSCGHRLRLRPIGQQQPRNVSPLEFLLVRLSSLDDERSQVVAGQSTTGITQVEEENVVDLVDHSGGSKLPPDRLEMLTHRRQ